MTLRSFATGEPLDRARLQAAELRCLPRPSRLRAPLQVKPARAARGATALGLHTVGDLLEHLPHRHQDRRQASAIAELRVGEDATVLVEVRTRAVAAAAPARPDAGRGDGVRRQRAR